MRERHHQAGAIGFGIDLKLLGNAEKARGMAALRRLGRPLSHSGRRAAVGSEPDAPHDAEIVAHHKVIDGAAFQRHDGVAAQTLVHSGKNRVQIREIRNLRCAEQTLARELKTEMEHEAEQLHFEQAAVLRNRIAAIEVLGKRQKVIAGVCADTDVWGLYTGAAKSGCAVVHVEDGSVTGRETSIFTAPTDETEADTLSALLSQYYLPRGVLPREILLPFAVDELSGLETVLTSRAGHRVTLRVPQRGEKAELLAMAERNAREEVERVTTAAEREDKTLRSLAAMCGLSAAPKRMESYDISNTGASDIVASMVVYAGARPLKRDYRRFKMKSVTAHPDDYASMEEVLTRRLQRYADGDEKFAPLPDVFLIDGGMTHAAVAEKVCAAFGLHIPIFGMVKDDRHRTRALTTAEGHEIDLHADRVEFDAVYDGARCPMTLGIPGIFSVYNALGVIQAAQALGLPLEKIAAALSTAQGVKGRAEVVPTPGKDYTVLIDYSHTPDSLENILKTVRGFCRGHVIAVFGCGGDRDRGKRPKMGRIAGQKADFVIVTSDNPRTEDPEAIIADILPGLKETHTPYVVRPDRREAIAYAIENHCPGDVIILCGKGHEDYQIIGKTKVHMDEREIVAEILDKRKREKEK